MSYGSRTFPLVSNKNISFNTAIQAAQNAVSKSTIGMLKNVDVANHEDEYALLYNATTEKWEAKSLNTASAVAKTIEDLVNVSDTAATNNQVLKYDTTTGLWTPADTGALTSTLGGLSDVDTASVTPTDGSMLLFDGTNWVTSPNALLIIYVSASGDNSNTGTTSGSPVANVFNGILKILQKGAITISLIRIMGADVLWNTSSANHINFNLLNGPLITRPIITGNSQNLSVVQGGPPDRQTGAALTGYAINYPGGVLSNGWNCTNFPTTLHWAEVIIDGAAKTLPVMVDEQSDNTGSRIYISYWDTSSSPGFASEPTLKDRTLVDSVIISNSSTIQGPLSINSLIIKCPDSSEVQFLNKIGMDYVEISPTTPGQTSHIIIDGRDTRFRYSRFTELTISCNGNSDNPGNSTDNDNLITFLNCIFINCSFTEAENVKFIGCIFYNNPVLFNTISPKVSFEVCTFVYSNTTNNNAALMILNNSADVKMENCILDLQKYSAGHNPLDTTIFGVSSSKLTLANVFVLDGVLKTDATGAQQLIYEPNRSCVAYGIEATILATSVVVTDTGAGDYALFNVKNNSELSVTACQFNTVNHTIITAGTNSNVSLFLLNDAFECSDFIIADRSKINLDNITSYSAGTYKINNRFMVITKCEVLGDKVHVDLGNPTSAFLNATDSNIKITTTSRGANSDVYGLILLLRCNLTINNSWNGSGKKEVRFLNGSVVPQPVLTAEQSTVMLENVSLTNENTNTGFTILCTNNTNLIYTFSELVADCGIINSAGTEGAISIKNNSNVSISGKVQNISSISDSAPTIECDNNSSININSSFELADATILTVQRDSAGTGTDNIIKITNGSKFKLTNSSSDKLNSANADTISATSPLLLLKGEDTNVGQAPILVDNNSSFNMEYSRVTWNKLNGPSEISNNSKLSLLQCSCIDDSSNGNRLSYFNSTDSTLTITGVGINVVSYIPKLIVQAKDDANQGCIISSNSSVVFDNINISSLTTLGTQQKVVMAKNNSLVKYIEPTNTTGTVEFGMGVQLRSNSNCVFKGATTNELQCTDDIVLGIPGGAVDTERKLTDMKDGNIIIPKQSNLVNYSALQAFIDEVEGCSATLEV